MILLKRDRGDARSWKKQFHTLQSPVITRSISTVGAVCKDSASQYREKRRSVLDRLLKAFTPAVGCNTGQCLLMSFQLSDIGFPHRKGDSQGHWVRISFLMSLAPELCLLTGQISLESNHWTGFTVEEAVKAHLKVPPMLLQIYSAYWSRKT